MENRALGGHGRQCDGSVAGSLGVEDDSSRDICTNTQPPRCINTVDMATSSDVERIPALTVVGVATLNVPQTPDVTERKHKRRGGEAHVVRAVPATGFSLEPIDNSDYVGLTLCSVDKYSKSN